MNSELNSLVHGSLIFRLKPLGNIKHPGVLVWRSGEWFVVHCAWDDGQVVMDRLDDFTRGRSCGIYNEIRPVFQPEIVAARALQAYDQGRRYDLFEHNCQHFVHEMATGQRSSQDLQFFGGVAFFTFVAWLLSGGLSQNRWDRNIGRYRDSNGRFVSG